MQSVIQNPTQPAKPKRLRAPPRKLPVPKREIDTWERLDSVSAPISFKDWIVNDKNARKQLKDGLRYLDARRPVKRKGKERENIQLNPTSQVHHVEAGDSDTDDYSSTESSITSTMDDYSSLTYDSDEDTIYDYPYKRETLLHSSPLSVMGTIYDRPVRIVIDSGSAISVISKSIADSIGLNGIGEQIPFTTLDTTK
ncbi:hypothetical protein EDC96DRAFT_444845, partial [Choanephora cucurbitarum]